MNHVLITNSAMKYVEIILSALHTCTRVVLMFAYSPDLRDTLKASRD